MFYTNYEQLCALHGLSVSAAADKMKISRANVTAWKNNPNTIPSGAILIKISDFFNVSTDFLLGKEKEPTAKGHELTRDQQDIMEKIRQLSPENLSKLSELVDLYKDHQDKKQ